MRLKFVPKAGLLVPWPGRGAGDYHFAGRTFDQATMTNAPDATPFEVDSAGPEASRFANDLCRRDGDLLPADEATAKFCGVPFVPVAQGADGEWAPVAKATPVASGQVARKSE